MRVAFVEDTLSFSIPLGITGVAAMLRHGGHESRAFVVGRNVEKTIGDIDGYRPDAVAFSVISGSHKGYYAIAEQMKARLGVPVIWGGPHPTFFPEVVETPYADAACVGEGEE